MTGDPAVRWRARPGYGRTRKVRVLPALAPLFPVRGAGGTTWLDDLTRASEAAAEAKHGPSHRTPHGRAGALYCQEGRP